MRKPPFYWLLTPWIFAAVLAITIIWGLVTGVDVSGLIMIIIGFAMFTGWAFLLLRMVDLGGSWRGVGIILGVLTFGIVPVLVVALIRHWFPNFLTTVELPARTRIWGTVSEGDAERIDRAAEQVEMKRAKFVAYAVLEQVERMERAGAAPIPDQGTVSGEESARPGEVQRLLDVIARVRGELAVAETKIAAQERVLEDAQRREEVWRDLIDQEKGGRRALLERVPLLPAPKEGFWSRIFRGRGRE